MANKIDACLQICADWGLIPTEFRQCMTWEEQVLWLGRFLQTVIVPTMNETITDFEELKTWVENYLDSQDFQQLVNNKLDEMAEDGTLGELIGQYIDDTYVTKTTYATAETGGAVKVGDTLQIEDGVLNEKTFADYLDNVQLQYTRYLGKGGYTDVWYAIIPAGTKPRLGLANGVVDSEALVSDMAHDTKSTLSVNAGAYKIADHTTVGGLVVDGEFIQDNDGETYAQYRELLYMTKGGRIDVLPYDATEQQIMSVNPDWAVQGFHSVIYNYQETEYAYDNTDYRERTEIGQDADGNYIVFTTSGRGYLNVGLNPKDCCDFCTSVGFTPRILYSLDGGGSAQIVYRGITMNCLAADTGETRAVANSIYWASPTAKTQGLFDEALAVNNAIVYGRKHVISTDITNQIGKETEALVIEPLKVWVQGETVFVTGHFNVPSGTTVAQYGTIITGLPLPDASSNVEMMCFARSDGQGRLLYINYRNGKLNNAESTALAQDTYEVNFSYKMKPKKTIDSTLEGTFVM